jgi:hypothetical protein
MGRVFMRQVFAPFAGLRLSLVGIDAMTGASGGAAPTVHVEPRNVMTGTASGAAPTATSSVAT